MRSRSFRHSAGLLLCLSTLAACGPAGEPPTVAGEYAAVLAGRVVYLEEVDLADGQLARVKLELTLTAADGERLWARTLESATSLRAGSAEEIVEQLRRDFQGLVAEAASEVAAVIGRRVAEP